MIHGLTDSITFRRDGKIRAGTREDNGKMHNPPHFLLHDAPQLIPVLGEHPKEMFFTVPTDEATEFFRDALRWYTSSELMCVGDGRTAAFMGFTDVAGLKQNKHPLFDKARERACLYTKCPQYVEGKCGEHFFLDMIVPQYSMGSVFTLDNTSKLAILNISSAINKAKLASGGKLAGQIFRLFKQVIDVPFTDAEKGKRYNREQAVIHMTYVPFQEYEAKFRSHVADEDWAALVGLRTRETRFVSSVPALDAPAAHVALPSPEEQVSEDREVKERANHESVVKLLDKLSALTGTPNTEENRVKTARNFPDVNSMADYLKKKIKEREKAPVVEAAILPKPAATAGAADANLF